jgi:hypothetical protein
VQFSRLIHGFIPKSRRDRWFIYYDEPHIFFHRSWTGAPVYRVTLKRTANGAETTEALYSKREAERFGLEPDEYHARLIDTLICNLLFGQEKPFPRLPPRVTPGLATFEESWDYTVKFVEEMPSHNPIWTPWTRFLLPLLCQCLEVGLNRYFRAGQSMSDIIISTTEHHRLESYEPPPPRVTIRFDREQGQWLIAWSYHNLITGPRPDRVSPVDSGTAFAVLRTYLIDLWRETRPEEMIPGPGANRHFSSVLISE